MFESVSHFLNTLLLLDIILAVLCCALIIKVKMRDSAKYVLIPLVLLSTYLLVREGEDLFGRPYDATPVGKFEFLDYRVDTSKGGKRIEVWVLQDGRSRLYVIPHSAKKEEQLAKAKNGKQKGIPQRGEFNRPEGEHLQNQDNIESDRPLTMYDINVQQSLPPKD